MFVPLALLGLVWLAPQDPFVAARDAAAAQHPDSSRFTIAFADQRRAFRPGEAIPVVFSYDGLFVSPFNYQHAPKLGLAEAHLDHTDGTVDPLADFDRARISSGFGIFSGVRGGTLGPGKSPPITFTVFLNQALRFDTAGHYRVYVTDRHPFDLLTDLRGIKPPLASNILEFDILPRDEPWETEAESDAIATLDTSFDHGPRVAAARTLRFLGSARAIDEMARRLERASGPQSETPYDEQSHLIKGLFGARDRERVIARMEEEADDPSRPLTSLYLRSLAALRLARTPGTPTTAAQLRAQYEAYSRRRLATLQRAGTLTEALYAEFHAQTWGLAFFAHPEQEKRPSPLGAIVTASIAAFPAESEAALNRLTPQRQRWMLLKGWREFAARPFVPMLERMAQAGGVISGTAVRLLNEIDPARARRLILHDFDSARPRVPIEGAGILPERFLPSLDRRFLQQLRTAAGPDEVAAAFDRIERYATSSIAADVKTAFGERREIPTCVAIPALAYFFRTNPVFARDELRRVWTVRHEAGEACRERATEDLLSGIARRHMTPALEDAAIAALAGTDASLIAAASGMLSTHGSRRAEAALWLAFEAWHRRWVSRVPQLLKEQEGEADWDVFLEQYLVPALQDGVAWSLSATDYDRMASLSLSDRWRDNVLHARGEYARGDRRDTVIRASGLHLETRRPRYFLAMNLLTTRRQLEIKVQQFPRGTAFTWEASSSSDDVEWSAAEQAAELARVRQILRRHGMTLRTHEP